MTDINGIPVIAPQQPPPQKPGLAIAQVAVDLAPGQRVLEIKLKAPALLRAMTYWGKKPAVIGSANLRQTEVIAMPMLFVECDPAGEMIDRVFVFQASDEVFAPRDGYAAVYRATAIGQVALHVFEIVEAKS